MELSSLTGLVDREHEEEEEEHLIGVDGVATAVRNHHHHHHHHHVATKPSSSPPPPHHALPPHSTSSSSSSGHHSSAASPYHHQHQQQQVPSSTFVVDHSYYGSSSHYGGGSSFSKGMVDLGGGGGGGAVVDVDGCLRSDPVMGELSNVLGVEGSASSAASHLQTEASVVDLYSSAGNPYSSPFLVYPAHYYQSSFTMDSRPSGSSSNSFPGASTTSSYGNNKKNGGGGVDSLLHDSKLMATETPSYSPPESSVSAYQNSLLRGDMSQGHSAQMAGLGGPSTPPSLLSMDQREKEEHLKDEVNHPIHHKFQNASADMSSMMAQVMPSSVSTGVSFMGNSISQNLRYSGLLSEVMPETANDPISSRIRVWLDLENKLFYDCCCGKRKPIRNLKGIKHHCARHDHQVFQCEKCDRVFSHYLGLNSHRKAHREDDVSSLPAPPPPPMDPSMLHHSSI